MTEQEKAALVRMVYEAMRFALWGAGEGLCPARGEPAESPEDFLYDYSIATDVDDWDGLPEFVRDTLKSALTQGHR
jgi:hypothetical protein